MAKQSQFRSRLTIYLITKRQEPFNLKEAMYAGYDSHLKLDLGYFSLCDVTILYNASSIVNPEWIKNYFKKNSSVIDRVSGIGGEFVAVIEIPKDGVI